MTSPHEDPPAPGRQIELEVEVPGTPEDVWAAIATGPGISSWFVPSRVEPVVGGVVETDFGDLGVESGRVLVWDPPNRVVFEGGPMPNGTLAFEWLVEARDGGSCIVRLVNTGFGPGDEWDGDYDGMTKGWRMFLVNLRLHLERFAGQQAVASVPMAVVPGPHDVAWGAMCDTIGIRPDLSPGDELRLLDGSDAAASAMVVEAVRATGISHYLLRLEEPPGHGFVAAEGDGDEVAISGYLYSYGPTAVAWGARWTGAWSRSYPSTAPSADAAADNSAGSTDGITPAD